MKENENFHYESIQDSQTIRDFFESLLDGLGRGRIELSSNGDKIELHPNSMLKFSVKAKKKASTGKITVKVAWKEETGNQNENEGKIKIS